MPRTTDRTFEVRDNRRRGFFMVFNELYDDHGAELGAYGLAVYMALCRYANRDQACWPSYNTIARGTGMSRRKVIYEVQKLEELNLISIERNQHTSNVFTLLDTSASGAPLSSASHAPSDARHAPRTKQKKNDLLTEEERRRLYIPEEYADIILG